MTEIKNTTLKGLFLDIESADFDALISAESSVRRILKLLGTYPTIMELIRRIQNDPAVANEVLLRMQRITELAADYRYRAKNDNALAAYLYAILVTSPKLTIPAGRIVLASENTYLSNKLVRLVLEIWSRTALLQTQEFSLAPITKPTHDFSTIDMMQIPKTGSNRPFFFIETRPTRSQEVSAFQNWRDTTVHSTVPDPDVERQITNHVQELTQFTKVAK